MQTFPTQSPDDRRLNVFDFTDQLGAGETIVLSSVSFVPSPGDLVLENPVASASGVPVWIRGGTASTADRLLCLAQTSPGRILVGAATIFVGPVGLDAGG